MPPSPSLRCSPGGERRMESSTHKRGHSFESGLTLKSKDDDLALFNDMQNNERDNFLLHTSDDFDESISKLRYISDFKLGINIPVRGESSDLLHVDGEKNDYDWLLTPPETPLFPSLDDDERQPVNLLPRGRPRSQPISISRSLTSERTHRTSRSSASPHRLSPSPRSSSSLPQLRGRPTSGPRSSPPPVLRPTTPSRRPSTPPNKPSTPAPRSSTPTIRRMSTGSSGTALSSGRRGTSQVKASRGSSSSPKLQGWQASLEDFSADAPPNLRTSLSDRPASHARGLSPSSRNGRDTSSKFGRHSMSPTASRSASSSHSHERDRLSCYSKGSIASSGDDDVDSLQSVMVDTTSSHTARKDAVTTNSRSMAFSRKPSRTFSASSAPKRSFDSAIRQMGHHKTPQNMFRPLLSSVPTTSFYVGKASNTHRPMFSRNSSLTTSSNASSEQGASNAPDMEGSDHEQNDLAGGWERTHDTDNQEEMFMFDKVDEINEDDYHEIGTGKAQNNDKVHAGSPYEVDPQKFENPAANFANAANVAAALDSSYTSGDHSVLVSNKVMATCSKCGKDFHMMEVSRNKILCEECTEIERSFTAGGSEATLLVHQYEEEKSEMAIKMDELCSALSINISVPELSEKSGSGVMLDEYERNNKHGHNLLSDNYPPQLMIDQREPHHSDQQLDRLQEINATQDSSENKFQQYQLAGPSNLKVDSSEVTGISVLLLQRSSSSKFPIVQGRNFSATNILCSEPSYARDNMNAMKHSIGRDSASASSSVDLGAYKKTGDHVQCQLSSSRYEVDKMANGVDARSQNTVIHSQVSINSNEVAFHMKGETEENFSGFTEVVEYEAFRETVLFTEEHCKSMKSANLCAPQLSVAEAIDINISVDADGCREMNTSEVSNHPDRICVPDTSVMDRLNDEDCNSCVSAEEDISENSYRSKQDIEVLNGIRRNSLTGEDDVLNVASSPNDTYKDAKKSFSGAILELENVESRFQEIQTGSVPSDNPSNMEASHEPSVCTTSENGVLDSAVQSTILNHACGIQEEPTVTVEGPQGHMSRSLTLEEATDSILFCSSIIHDLAYKAANIGMEKELMLLEGSRPTVTLLGNSVSRQKDPRKLPDKSIPKSQKFKRKRLETNTKATELGNSVKVEEPRPSNEEIQNKPIQNKPIQNKLDSIKPPKLESKCNCSIM